MISSPSRLPRVALAGNATERQYLPAGTTTDWTDWTDLTADVGAPLSTPVTVRIQAADLRQAQTTTRRLRLSEEQAGRDPQDLIVLLDLEFLIATDARTARAELSLHDSDARGPDSGATVRYVGTPRGLAGLISDIRAASVADGVMLIPLAASDTSAELVAQVLPLLTFGEATE